MNQIDPATPLTVTLQAQEWNLVTHFLGKQPYEAVAPLIDNIRAQARAAAGQAPTLPLTNGEDTHAPH